MTSPWTIGVPLLPMARLEQAVAAHFVVGRRFPWGERAPEAETQVVRDYWEWCQKHEEPFVFVQLFRPRTVAPYVNVVLDLHPTDPDGKLFPERAIEARLYA